MALQLTKLDPVNLPDHYDMTEADECYFLRSYTRGLGYTGGETNNLIINFKKKMDRRGLADWRYKDIAIRQLTSELAAALNPEYLRAAVLVPTPPSKPKDHKLYNGRMTQVCEGVAKIVNQVQVDVRELVYQAELFEAGHKQGDGGRKSIQELYDNYRIDEALTNPAPQLLAIVDDMLTNGRHFQAMKRILSKRFPGVPIIGIFLSRRAFPGEPEPFDN